MNFPRETIQNHKARRNTPVVITVKRDTAERFLVVDVDPPADGMARVALLVDPTDAPRPDPTNRWQ